jgi:hypothetical protein
MVEPLHLNLLSVFALAFGSLRTKIAFDLVPRPQYAFGLLKAADLAAAAGISSFTALEFGVASGSGLLNMAEIAMRVTAATGVGIHVVGFDSGAGMPPPEDYRDHPDLYQEGDFQMNFEALQPALPGNASLIIGNVAETVTTFLADLPADSPIGFASVDVDYYSSTVAALGMFSDPEPKKYLPLTVLYFDDIDLDPHNSFCGEQLAISEFNRAQPRRRIESNRFLDCQRVFRRARWIRKMHYLHVTDHPARARAAATGAKRFIANPYLSFAGNRDVFDLTSIR